MGLAYEIRQQTAKIRAEQARRNAEALKQAEAERKDAERLAAMDPEERRLELRRRELGKQQEQAERNAAAKGAPPENKAASGPPENKAATPKRKARRGKKG